MNDFGDFFRWLLSITLSFLNERKKEELSNAINEVINVLFFTKIKIDLSFLQNSINYLRAFHIKYKKQIDSSFLINCVLMVIAFGVKGVFDYEILRLRGEGVLYSLTPLILYLFSSINLFYRSVKLVEA